MNHIYYNILYTKVALDCDGKITSQQLQQDKSILNKYWVLNVANEGCSIPAKVRNDNNILYTKVALDWDGKMTSQLQDKSTGCNLNPILGKGMQGEKEEKEEPFSV